MFLEVLKLFSLFSRHLLAFERKAAACLSMRSAVPHITVFNMGNTVRESDSSWEECADEGPISPIAEAKRLGANLATSGKAKIARERKIQTNPARVKRAVREDKMI